MVFVLTAGCGGGNSPAPDGGEKYRPNHPPAKGPVETVARGEIEGETWRLTAYRSDEGVCVDLHLGSNSGGGCGFGPLRSDLAFSGVGWSNEFPHLAQLEGRVSKHVDRVTLRSGNDATKELPLYRSKSFDQTFVVAFVPVNKRAVFTAYDRRRVLQRRVFKPRELNPRP